MRSLPRHSNLMLRSLVKILAQSSLVCTLMTWTMPFRTWLQKWWYLMDRCLVRGQMALEVVMLRQLWLSSKTSDFRWPEKMQMPDKVMSSMKLHVKSSWIRVHMGRRLCMQVLKAWYLALVVLNAVSVCNCWSRRLDIHNRLVHNWCKRGCDHIGWSKLGAIDPQSQHKHKHLKNGQLGGIGWVLDHGLGKGIIWYSWAFSWRQQGWLENIVHWWTANEMLGWVLAAMKFNLPMTEQ